MVEINGHNYRELRCNQCHKLIIFERIMVGYIAYVCPRCNFVNQFSFKILKTKAVDEIIPDEFFLENLKGGEK